MSNKFTAIAKKATVLSPVMTGREKISTPDLIRRFPDGVTVTEFDLITVTDKGKESTFPVLAIAEDPAVCFFGGAVLTKIVSEWSAAYGGDIEAASADLKAAGGVRMKMKEGRTKNGNNVTTVTILE